MKKAFMRLNPGDKVRITGGAGIESGKTGIVLGPDDIKNKDDGSPINWNREIAIRLDSGQVAILPRMRAIKVSMVVRELLRIAKLLS